MSEPASQRPTRIRVDLDALSHNLGAIREHVRVPVMGIVKANAYGHGLVPVARHLEAQGVDQLGVGSQRLVVLQHRYIRALRRRDRASPWPQRRPFTQVDGLGGGHQLEGYQPPPQRDHPGAFRNGEG